MGFLSKIWKGVKRVVGAVAMIAAPFIAAPIAGMIGISGTIGTALVGAGIGGLGAAAAGVNPLIGAAIGGLGAGIGAARAAGGAGGGGLFGGLFRGAAPAAGAAGTAGAAAAPAAAAGLTTAAAAPAAGGLFSGLNLANLAPLAMSMFGKAPQDLTEVERQNLLDNAEIAATERGVFNERLDAARSLLQQGEANPEQAFATAQMATQRGLREQERTSGLSERPGMREAERRRAAIEGARVGTAAVTGEQARAAQATAAGLSALPTNVPTSASELNKTIYEDLYKRRSDYARDLAGGFGQMYGSIA
jgi:hypothetical protein